MNRHLYWAPSSTLMGSRPLAWLLCCRPTWHRVSNGVIKWGGFEGRNEGVGFASGPQYFRWRCPLKLFSVNNGQELRNNAVPCLGLLHWIFEMSPSFVLRKGSCLLKNLFLRRERTALPFKHSLFALFRLYDDQNCIEVFQRA